MGYKIKNITYLLDKKNVNHNKPVIFKIKKNQRFVEYKIIPYQELIFDSKLLPIEIKKMELLGMVQCIPVNDNFINSLTNSKKNEPIKKEKKVIESVEKKTNKRKSKSEEEDSK
jgi:hypothetical protein